MIESVPDGKLLTAREVAEMFQVDQVTVRRWIHQGKLQAFRAGDRCKWRISKEAVQLLTNTNLGKTR